MKNNAQSPHGLLKLIKAYIKRQDHVLATLSWLECTSFIQKGLIVHEICWTLQSMQNLIPPQGILLSSLYIFHLYFCIAFSFYTFCSNDTPHNTDPLNTI